MENFEPYDHDRIVKLINGEPCALLLVRAFYWGSTYPDYEHDYWVHFPREDPLPKDVRDWLSSAYTLYVMNHGRVHLDH